MTSVASVGARSIDGAAVPARVNTKAARRRLVSYTSLSDLLKDLEKVEAAHRAGTLRRLGNHEAGPNLAHIAIGMRGSFDGFPTLAPSWLRVVGRLLKKRILSREFTPGFNLRKQDEGKAWDDTLTFDQGLQELRTQVARAAANDARPDKPHPFFGPMTPAEWQVYYLRHAELHMSFLQI